MVSNSLSGCTYARQQLDISALSTAILLVKVCSCCQVLQRDLAEDQPAHLARIGALFDKPQFSDVRVVAADGDGFYCHRAILAACSKPFERAMLTEGTPVSTLVHQTGQSLCGPCGHSAEYVCVDMQHVPNSLEVRLKDTSSVTLQAVLRFCYTAECLLVWSPYFDFQLQNARVPRQHVPVCEYVPCCRLQKTCCPSAR